MDPKPQNMMPLTNRLGILAACLVLCFLPALIGQAVTLPEIQGWYSTLNKPSWNPPDWIFGPVWTLLYILMAVSLWQIILRKSGSRVIYRLFAAQLVCNALWSVIFFGMHHIAAALLDILILWVFIAVLILKFWKVHRPSAFLLIPYLAWISFAGVLNFVIWRMNG